MAGRKKRHLFDDPRNVKRAIYLLYAICLAALTADFVLHRHIESPLEEMVGFYCIYGFVACVLLVLIAKQMRKLLMRGNDYYDD